MSTLNFDTMSDDDFADTKSMPKKPAGRNSPPSKFAPMLRELMANGKVKSTKRPLDSRKPAGGGASQVEQMERELRRAARQIGGKVSIRKINNDDNGGMTLSFNVKPLEEDTEEDTEETPSTLENTASANGKAEGVPAPVPTPAPVTGAAKDVPKPASKARVNA